MRGVGRPATGRTPPRQAQLAGMPLERGKHLDVETRRQVGARLRKLYEEGASVRELADATDRSYGSIHRLLLEAGTTLRERGGASHRHRRL
ncbi:helix-turn-helix domain-containing protein [Streptomyces sp. XH2]|uniref:helix-turn-helix domain-containing protein n=1 Tax=Streptomyces sp. XH2 TaxID=3412483 RepID=UPI003C7E7206